ncbi:MAG: SPOR domain-containing protein, partial [Thermodesulfobacteriota bacterium]
MKHIARLYNEFRDRKSDKALTRGTLRASLLLLLMALLFTPGTAYSAREPRGVETGRYVVSLISNTRPINTGALQSHEAFKGHTLYTTKARINGVLWHRLRLGFFPTKKAAEKEMAL